MRTINPTLSVKTSKMRPFKFADDEERILMALRAAGLPNFEKLTSSPLLAQS
jgi:hypothetical protein